MDLTYALHQDVTIRNEYFGCLVCDTSTGRYFQFNEDAFNILKVLVNPRTVGELHSYLHKQGYTIPPSNLQLFLDDLKRKRLLSVDPTRPLLKPTLIEKPADDLRHNCLSAPASCTIYITDFCSKQCLHCVTRSSPFLSQDMDLPPDEWHRIFKSLREWGVVSLVFTGGEPLLKVGIYETLAFADELGFNISLLTDFDGMKQSDIDKLSSFRHLNDVQTSLDGATEETHDYIRGKGSFKKTLRRLELLQNSGLSFTISASINKINLREIDGIIELYKKYGAANLYMNPVAPYGRAKEAMQDLILDDNELKALAYRYYLAVSSEGVNSGNAYWQTLTEEDVLQDSFHPYKNCLSAMSIGAYVFSINAKGDCYLDSKMKSEGLLCLGNVQKDNFAKMWSDSRLEHLRKYYQGGSGAFIAHEEVINITRRSQVV